MTHPDDHTHFTEDALKAQDGKKVPLTASPGGPVIGEATLTYDPETKTLSAQLRVDDPKLAEEIGMNNLSPIVLRQER
jgi:hypothetical protein